MGGLGDDGGLRKEEEEGIRGRSLAAVKSCCRAEELGSVMADERGVVLLGKPRNWDVRSSYWLRRAEAWSALGKDLVLGMNRFEE